MSHRLPPRLRTRGSAGVWPLLALLLFVITSGSPTTIVHSSHAVRVVSHPWSQLAAPAAPTGLQASLNGAPTPSGFASRVSGDVWSNVTGNQRLSPSARVGSSMAFDSVDGYLVQFGGCGSTGCPAPAATWRYFGGSWSQVAVTGVQPPARSYANLVFDSKDLCILLFGGLGAGGVALNDTWTYLGGKWTPVNATTAPSPRWAASATWDHADGELVLFGGRNGTQPVYNDTWTYVAGVWKNITSQWQGSPPARWGAGLVWNEAVGYAILMDGCGTMTCPLNDTWTFRAGTWTNTTGMVNPVPPARYLASMTFMGSEGAVYVVGGNGSGGARGDAWRFSGTSWTNVTGALGGSPTARIALTGPQSTTTWGTTQAKQWPFLLIYGGSRGGCPTCVASALNETWVLEPQLYATPTALPSVVETGEPVSFASAASGGSAPYFYVWQMGDGASIVGANFTHAYSTVGSYSALITAIDQAGASARAAAGITVVAGPAVSVTASRVSTDVGKPVQFSGSASGGTSPYSYRWSFGDLTAATGASASHAFASPGNFTVNLTATDSVQGSGHRALTLVIHPIPQARAVANLVNAVPGETVAFGSTVVGGTPALVYNWSFGDGTFNSTADPFHVYRAAGNYLVMFSVTDALGLSSFSNLTLQIGTANLGGGGGGAGGGLASSPYLWAGIGAALMAVALAAFIVLRRRRKLNPPIAAAAAGGPQDWYNDPEALPPTRDTRSARRSGSGPRRR